MDAELEELENDSNKLTEALEGGQLQDEKNTEAIKATQELMATFTAAHDAESAATEARLADSDQQIEETMRRMESPRRGGSHGRRTGTTTAERPRDPRDPTGTQRTRDPPGPKCQATTPATTS